MLEKISQKKFAFYKANSVKGWNYSGDIQAVIYCTFKDGKSNDHIDTRCLRDRFDDPTGKNPPMYGDYYKDPCYILE